MLPPPPYSPAATILLLTAGVLLLAVEFNRPGLIVAGAAGLLSVLLGFASVARLPHSGETLPLLLLATACLAADLRRPKALLPWLGGLLLVAGYVAVARSECPAETCSPATQVLAGGCALLVAVTTAILARIARRARINKGLD